LIDGALQNSRPDPELPHCKTQDLTPNCEFFAGVALLTDGALQNSRPDPELPMLPTLRDRAMRLPAVLERHLRDAIDPFGLRGHKIFTARGDLLG
jgi:hypothetical protein